MDFNIHLAGMNAATRRLEDAAVGIARATARPIGGPAAQAGRGVAAGPPDGAAAAPPADPAGAADRAAGGAAVPGSGTMPVSAAAESDLPGAMVEQIAASAAFLANVSALRRTDSALESLLRDT